MQLLFFGSICFLLAIDPCIGSSSACLFYHMSSILGSCIYVSLAGLDAFWGIATGENHTFIFVDGSPKIYFLARYFVTWSEKIERRTTRYTTLNFSIPPNIGIHSWLSFPAWKHLPWHYEPLLSMHANSLLHDLARWVMNVGGNGEEHRGRVMKAGATSFWNKHVILEQAPHFHICNTCMWPRS